MLLLLFSGKWMKSFNSIKGEALFEATMVQFCLQLMLKWILGMMQAQQAYNLPNCNANVLYCNSKVCWL